MKSSKQKKIIIWASIIFLASCLFPPWQLSVDQGSQSFGDGIRSPSYHLRKPAGYSLLFITPEASGGQGLQIDFGRLFLEWGALAAVTGLAWMFVGKNE